MTSEWKVEISSRLPCGSRAARRCSSPGARFAALRCPRKRIGVPSAPIRPIRPGSQPCPVRLAPRTAGWLTKQAGSQSNATQRKQRTATQKPWSCRELRRRKIEERFWLPDPPRKTSCICHACCRKLLIGTRSADAAATYTRHRSEKLHEPPLFHPSTGLAPTAKCTTRPS